MEKKKINISAIQMCAKIGDKKSNYKKVTQLATEIKQTDIIVLPEVWNTGWACNLFQSNAENICNSATLDLQHTIKTIFILTMVALRASS